VTSQLESYEYQLVQSKEQLYEARSQVESLTAQISEGKNSMQTIKLHNLISFLNSTVVKLERKLEAQKESFDFSTEQHNMHLEDVRSQSFEIRMNRDLQTNISDESSQSILLQQQSVWEQCRRSYETQLMQSEEQLYAARAQVDLLTSQALEEQNSMQLNDLWSSRAIIDLQGQLEEWRELHAENRKKWNNRTVYISDLKSRIDELESKLKSLRSQNSDLRSAVERLKQKAISDSDSD
jgi:predicted  nucleic acid-binding Zn-ribbon protein